MIKLKNAMEIIHIAHSSFKIRTKNVVLLTDPFNPHLVGIKFPVVTPDIITISHQHENHNFVDSISGTPVVVSGPGEYEIKKIKIMGIGTYHDAFSGEKRGRNTIYHIDINGISLVHCGDLGHKLNDKQVELLNGVEILMIPVGGICTISASQAAEVVSQLEPKIVIPMHYKTSKASPENLGKLSDVDIFLKEMGKEEVVPQQKLVISKDKLPEELSVVVLQSFRC